MLYFFIFIREQLWTSLVWDYLIYVWYCS